MVVGKSSSTSRSITEMARRMEVQGPSLYNYFPSLHAVYDALFARGLAGNGQAVEQAIADVEPGVERLHAGAAATVRWCVANSALAQLLYWRPVPGFAPSARTFAAGRDQMADLRVEFAAAVTRGELVPDACTDEATRLFTVVMSGLISQQMANEPGASYDDGAFTSLTDEALEMFFDHYRRH